MTPESFIPTAIGWVLAAAVFIFVLVVIVRSIRIIPQADGGRRRASRPVPQDPHARA